MMTGTVRLWTPLREDAVMRRVGPLLVGVVGLLASAGGCAAAEPATALRFEVTLARGLSDAPLDGRLLVVLDRGRDREPRLTIGETGLAAPPFLGRDVKGFVPGKEAVVDRGCAVFPIDSLDRLPAGTYRVQAVLDV